MPTNGTQPLTTFLWGLGYALVGPERAAGVFFAQVLQLFGGLGTAVLLRKLVQRMMHEREEALEIGWLAAGLWWASPVVMPHTMNCLETGFAGLLVTGIVFAFVWRSESGKVLELWPWWRVGAFGALLGLGFWVRNDIGLLIAAVCLAYLLPARAVREELKPRLARVFAFGSISVLVASPWLIFNVVRFGHLMPISGRAEALTGHLGGNLTGVPIVLAEFFMGVVPIPESISQHIGVVVGSSLLCAVVLAACWRTRESWTPTMRIVGFVGAVLLVGMSGFYGVYFGARWFLPRYFAPMSALLILPMAWTLWWAWGRLGETPVAMLRPLVPVGMLAVMTFLSLRQYRAGEQHPHFQVVAWVAENVQQDQWVGAIQTGTLGFFHDRTVNLDGKVNVAAYEALVAGREGEYVVEDTEIVVLADWIGMLDWLTKPAIAENFEVVVEDHEDNLGVLRRRGSEPAE